MAKLIPTGRCMTKCHVMIFMACLIICASGCRSKSEDKPLAYYAFQSRIAQQEKTLYDPNSPYRDEDAYIPVLEEIIASPYADSLQKARAARLLPLARLNSAGTLAADFEFTLRNGRTSRLSEVATDQDYILLMFSNPGCADCSRVTKAVSGMKNILIINIFPDDDLDAWLEYSAEYPADWICGYAPQVDEFSEEDGTLPLYHLRAIPSLYLLDRDHHVILKDPPIEKVAHYATESRSVQTQ